MKQLEDFISLTSLSSLFCDQTFLIPISRVDRDSDLVIEDDDLGDFRES